MIDDWLSQLMASLRAQKVWSTDLSLSGINMVIDEGHISANCDWSLVGHDGSTLDRNIAIGERSYCDLWRLLGLSVVNVLFDACVPSLLTLAFSNDLRLILSAPPNVAMGWDIVTETMHVSVSGGATVSVATMPKKRRPPDTPAPY